MKIRKAKSQDIPEIIELFMQYEKFYDKMAGKKNNPCYKKKKNPEKVLSKELRKVIKSRKDKVFVAEVEKKIVGFIWIGIKYDNWVYAEADDYGEIEYLFVKNSYRGKGISSMLRKKSFEWFRKKKVQWVMLHVHKKNKKAHKVYKKWGYEDYEKTMWRRI